MLHLPRMHRKAQRPVSNPSVIFQALVLGAALGLLIGLMGPWLSTLQSPLSPAIATINSLSVDALAAQLHSANPDIRAQAINQLASSARSGSPEALDQLAGFFRSDTYLTEQGPATARAIASVGTRPAYEILIQGLAEGQPSTRQMSALTALEEAKANVTPVLIAALQNRDSGVRANSAELLGYRHEATAADALLKATYDANADVREAAAWTLGGDLAVWQSLTRMQLLAVTDPSANVRAAAQRADDHIRTKIAWALGLEPSDLTVVAVAPVSGVLYAATNDALYAMRDAATWQQLNNLPDVPVALAAGGVDGQNVYLGTLSSGPYRSQDGGRTWERVKTGLPDAERLSVTALTVDPSDASAQQVYMALAATVGTVTNNTTPLGIYHSADGGKTWSQLEKVPAPAEFPTTRLILDPNAPNDLYGLTEAGAWRTTLS